MYDKLKNILQEISKISDAEWELFRLLLHEKKYKKGEFFTRAEEIEEKIGFINEGYFRWYYTKPNGDEINYHFYFEDWFVTDFESCVQKNLVMK